jgi:hypothetical protein
MNVRESYVLCSHATVFQCEVYAILASSEYCISEDIVNRAVSICSDSRVALLAPKSSSIVVPQCRDSLQELALSNRVRLVWVPGHCGIHGNEEGNQVLLLWARSLVFRWHLRVSSGGSGSGNGYLNHTAPHRA